MNDASSYPVDFAVEYPDRELERLTTLLRPLAALPILLLFATVAGSAGEWEPRNANEVMVGACGFLVLGPILMLLFRRKYPRWWFDWNLELYSPGGAAYGVRVHHETQDGAADRATCPAAFRLNARRLVVSTCCWSRS